jgi:hypothetical protein
MITNIANRTPSQNETCQKLIDIRTKTGYMEKRNGWITLTDFIII